MTTANAVTDGVGRICPAGGGISSFKVSMDYLQDRVKKLKLSKKVYKKCLLVNLVNSTDEKFNMLARELETCGNSLMGECEFARIDGFHIIKINKINYCLKGNKIHTLKA